MLKFRNHSNLFVTQKICLQARRVSQLIMPFVFLFAALGITQTAHPSDIRVTSTIDSFDGTCDSNCSLREAIELANQIPGHDRLIMSAGRYLITREVPEFGDDFIDAEGEQTNETPNDIGDFDILDSLTIVGEGRESTIVDGNRISRIFQIHGVEVTLADMTLTNGIADGNVSDGGCIKNSGNLTLTRVAVSKCRAVTWWGLPTGAAVANYGITNVYSSLLDENIASQSDDYYVQGAGIYNAPVGKIKVRDSVFSKNVVYGDVGYVGAAIYNEGVADIRRSLFVANRADDLGGFGMALVNKGGDVKIVSSTFFGNIGGRRSHKPGGTIANIKMQSREPKMALTQLTIVANQSGGLYTDFPMYIRNSIIAANYVTEFPIKELEYRDCLFDYQSGVFEPGDVVVKNVVATYGTPYNCDADIRGIYNPALIFATDLIPLNINSTKLQALGLRNGSIAIDAGGFQCPEFDNEGRRAPVDANGEGVAMCDIGASEWQQPMY